MDSFAADDIYTALCTLLVPVYTVGGGLLAVWSVELTALVPYSYQTTVCFQFPRWRLLSDDRLHVDDPRRILHDAVSYVIRNRWGHNTWFVWFAPLAPL
jgi:hypothetical protein